MHFITACGKKEKKEICKNYSINEQNKDSTYTDENGI